MGLCRNREMSAVSSEIAFRRFAERALVDAELELEISLDVHITAPMFRRLVKTLRTELGSGADVNDTFQLDITRDSTRYEYHGHDLINATLARGSLQHSALSPGSSSTPSRILVKKREMAPVSHEEYDYTIKLKREMDITGDGQQARMADPSTSFRLKRRFSFPAGICRIDCTVVQAKTPEDQPRAHIPFTYEVEIEYVSGGGDVPGPDAIVSQMSATTQRCLCVMLGSSAPVTKSERAAVLAAFSNAADGVSQHQESSVQPPVVTAEQLSEDPAMGGQVASVSKQVGGRSAADSKPARSRTRLPGPQPVTLVRRHIIEAAPGDQDAQVHTSIWSGYTVTDKADGIRCALFVYNHTAYTIDSTMTVRRVAVGLPDALDGLLADGELITCGKEGDHMNQFLGFDIYGVGGTSLMNLPLMLEGPGKCRLVALTDALGQIGSGAALDGFAARAKDFALVDAEGAAVRRALVSARNVQPYETDGLIFTPAHLAVGARYAGDDPTLDGVWPQALKWKPPHLNTIDFLVRVSGKASAGSQGTISVMPAPDGTAPVKCRVFDLFASYVPRTWEALDVSKYMQFGERAFPSRMARARRFDPPGTPHGARLFVPLDSAGRAVCADGDPVYDEMIVECAYDTEHELWTPLRLRPEKTARYTKGGIAGAANDWGTAVGVWGSIAEPVTEAALTRLVAAPSPSLTSTSAAEGGIGDVLDAYYAQRDFGRERSALRAMANFHNNVVKASLFSEAEKLCAAVGAPALFEMACGKGGDASRWAACKYSPIVGVDRSLDNIVNSVNGIYARITARHSQAFADRTFAFVCLDASTRMRPPLDEVRIAAANSPHGDVISALWDASKRPLTATAFTPIRGLLTQGFDVVSCQFAVHYLFDNDLNVDRLVKNLDYLVRPGGIFIGTCFDGDRIAKQLAASSDGTMEGRYGDHIAWRISKLYEGEFAGRTGAPIDVFVETINQTVTEYLVSPRLLEARLRTIGMEPVFIKPFAEYFADAPDPLSNVEKAFSELNMAFMFKRAGGASSPGGGDVDDN